MKIGFVGAGRVACSLGKYLALKGLTITGYYDTCKEAADSAAEFTYSKSFEQLSDIVCQSTLLFLTTPDGIIKDTWEAVKDFVSEHQIICHCSGALPADVFTGIEQTKAFGCSLHPMLPFNSRYSSYEQLEGSFFTIEGSKEAVEQVSALFTGLGNTVCQISGNCKPKYHAAASILSNQVVAVLDTGYHLLEECGFTREDAVHATEALVQQNIDHILHEDCIRALTGPIERNDIQTVQKHIDCLNTEDREMYQILGQKLVHLSEKKHPDFNYKDLLTLLQRI